MGEPRLLKPHVTNLPGGLRLRRLLPAAACRSVGPFFFDHFGPVELPAELDSDIGPHPHIGLATVTYLFEGEAAARDSLGTEPPPGAINWMSAGGGIVHSERTPGSPCAARRGARMACSSGSLCRPTTRPRPRVSSTPGQTACPSCKPRLACLCACWSARLSASPAPCALAARPLYLDPRLDPAPLGPATLAPELCFTRYRGFVNSTASPCPRSGDGRAAAGQGAVLEAATRGARLAVIGGAPLQQTGAAVVELRVQPACTARSCRAALGPGLGAWGFEPILGEEAERIAGPAWKARTA